VTNQAQKLHRIRTEHPDPPIEGELKDAHHALQLYWLAEYPEYRKLIRERVSQAARKAEQRSNRIDKEHENVDYLGREIEGCG
jgi:hypothetical protein